MTQERGFSVILWRDGELGYALVSDLNTDELMRLATAVANGSEPADRSGAILRRWNALSFAAFQSVGG